MFAGCIDTEDLLGLLDTSDIFTGDTEAQVRAICDKCTTGQLWYDRTTHNWFADEAGQEFIDHAPLSAEQYAEAFGDRPEWHQPADAKVPAAAVAEHQHEHA